MNTIKKVFIYSLLIISISSQAQNKKYLEDFNFFVRILKETHPDPYSGYGGQIEFYRSTQLFHEKIKDIESDADFINMVNSFVSPLADGHTGLNSIDIVKSDNDDLKTLPLQFSIAANGIYVQNCTEDYKDLKGLKVDAINNIHIEELLKLVSKLYPSENIYGAYLNLIRMLKTNISSQQLFGNSELLSFSFSDNEQTINKKIPFVTEVNFLNSTSMIETGNNPLLGWKMIGTNKEIGYFYWNRVESREMVEQVNRDASQYTEMNLNSVYKYTLKRERSGNIKEDIEGIPSLYEQFYLLMKEMNKRNSTELIIDLRKNTGGMTPLCIPLIYIIYQEAFLNYEVKAQYIKKISPLYLKKTRHTLKSFNSNWKTDYKMGDYIFDYFYGSLNHMSKDEKIKYLGNYFRLGSEYIYNAYNNKPDNLNIYVLTSPKTFSAAYHFTYFLKEVGNATIIGVASSQAGNTFMESTHFELPETKITGSISNAWQMFYPDDSEYAKVLHPDFGLDWTEFSKYNFDPNTEILKAIDWIESNR